MTLVSPADTQLRGGGQAQCCTCSRQAFPILLPFWLVHQGPIVCICSPDEEIGAFIHLAGDDRVTIATVYSTKRAS